MFYLIIFFLGSGLGYYYGKRQVEAGEVGSGVHYELK